MSKDKYKIGLVLSGGGARGFAHLGVIQALNEAGIFLMLFPEPAPGQLQAHYMQMDTRQKRSLILPIQPAGCVISDLQFQKTGFCK